MNVLVHDALRQIDVLRVWQMIETAGMAGQDDDLQRPGGRVRQRISRGRLTEHVEKPTMFVGIGVSERVIEYRDGRAIRGK